MFLPFAFKNRVILLLELAIPMKLIIRETNYAQDSSPMHLLRPAASRFADEAASPEER